MKRFLYFLPALALLMLFGCASSNKQLSKEILNDSTLVKVNNMAHELLKEGFNAGGGYSQTWARDMNTFVEPLCSVRSSHEIREAILLFFALQQPNGEMIDGYVKKEDFNWVDTHPYYSSVAPAYVAFKNTVETDQESSLIQIVGKYISKTGDTSILQQKVGDKTVLERITWMIDYLWKERFSEKYGLLFGAMTSDWGDVQPGTCFPCDYNECSFPAIDVYDNAMMIIAFDRLLKLDIPDNLRKDWTAKRQLLFNNSRKYLWDSANKKFIPHIYLDKKPDMMGMDENKIYYHGGTAVAIEAGLLSKSEIKAVNKQMVENVRLSGMPTVGVTIYPPYPQNFYPGGMANPYIYQNGGDWTWFGGRMIQQLVAHGLVKEAYAEARPMIDRVIKNKGFYEWYGMGNVPKGSPHFKGSAGVLAKAVEMLQSWAKDKR
jgi:hypothetical protein